jgi:endoplasmic reticulum Man9GlcNAc2 1,2-alpha-mannosidase
MSNVHTEYLIKQYLQTSEQEPVYKEMWDEALMGIRKHLITYSKDARLTVLAERPDGLQHRLLPKMDHLVCFMPGTIALAATSGKPLAKARASSNWGQVQDEEMRLAKELMKTCWAMYAATATGLAPEITYFHVDGNPVMEADMYPDSTVGRLVREGISLKAAISPSSTYQSRDLPLLSEDITSLSDSLNGEIPAWRRDIDIHPQDHHNLQRPETVESLFYMYRITGDETYRHWGWEMFQSFIKYTAVVEDEHRSLFSKTAHFPSDFTSDTAGTTKTDSSPSSKDSTPKIVGFTSLSNANTIPPVERDNMESFWMAETLKYFYLLFSDRDFLPLEKTVFNTEAHPLPRFQLGGDLKTGWKREPRLIAEEGGSSGGESENPMQEQGAR